MSAQHEDFGPLCFRCVLATLNNTALIVAHPIDPAEKRITIAPGHRAAPLIAKYKRQGLRVDLDGFADVPLFAATTVGGTAICTAHAYDELRGLH